MLLDSIKQSVRIRDMLLGTRQHDIYSPQEHFRWHWSIAKQPRDDRAHGNAEFVR